MHSNFIGRAGATPEEEDRALFKTYGGPIDVEVVPQVSQPSEHLFMAKAYFETNKEIIAVISGRRARETDTLARALRQMESRAQQRAVKRRASAPNSEDIRLPVSIKGAWQCQFQSNPNGEDVKVFQLLVARWAFRDARGQLHQFGEAPAFDVSRRRRNASYILQSREIDAVPRGPRSEQT